MFTPWMRTRQARHARSLLSALCTAGAVACHSPLGAGIAAFEESRFPDAVAELRQRPDALGEAERTRWALYLGLSELSLGNLARAVGPLREARCGLEANPLSLNAAERGQLASAWQALGKMPGEPLLHPCPNAI